MINTELYKEIADLIDSIQSRGGDNTEFAKGIVTNISLMRDNLSNNEVSMENFDKLWLFNTLDTNYDNFYNKHFLKSKNILNFVRKLQVYIEKYSELLINNYLRNNGIKVLPMFAEISELVGYLIDDSNIDRGGQVS